MTDSGCYICRPGDPDADLEGCEVCEVDWQDYVGRSLRDGVRGRVGDSTEFTREVRFRKGYDHRDEPDGKRGAHGMEVHFILRGPLGVIQAVVSTGWMMNPLAGAFVRGGVQRRRRGVGVDAGIWDHYPTGSFVTSHVAAPPDGKDWFMGPHDCDLLPGGACYGDTGYLYGKTFLERLVGEGEDAAWGYLHEIHDDWLAPEPAETRTPTTRTSAW